jgi:capsid protein
MKFAFEISRQQRDAKPGTGGAALVTPVVKPKDAQIIRESQKMFPNARGRMYEAAQVNRLTSDFGISIASGNAQILNSYIGAVARARTLERDNPYAWRAIQLMQNNVGGSEPFKLELKLGEKDSTGKFTKDKAAIEKIKAAWKKAGRKENCTVRQDMTRDECYWQAIAAFFRDGLILWRKYTGFPNNDFKFGIETIETDRLDHWLNRPAVGTANEIQFGIERNKYRAPVAFHILTRH